MIDVTSQIVNIEAIMKLMEKFHVDEVSVDFICIKKTKHLPFKIQLTDKELLDKHTEPEVKSAQSRIEEVVDWIGADPDATS